SGKYLSVDGHVQNGARVIGSNHQQIWKITPDGQHPNGHFLNFLPGTHLNLDLEDRGNSTPGARVQLWETSPGKNQAWFFQSL
ncbi:carbohydrate-binding module family 13 protein, partial [Hydnum rufescens UP504]